MRLLLLAVLLTAACAQEDMYNTCMSEKTDMGETIVRTIMEGERHTIRCPGKQGCKWRHGHKEMPRTMDDMAINSNGHLIFKSPTWAHSGQYTMNDGRRYVTYHIIVMSMGMTEMTYEMHEDHVIRNMEFRNMYWHNHHIKDYVFENVKFINMHWHLMKMENVKFINCTWHWDEDRMYPMQAEFYKCDFEHSSWNRPHMKDCSFLNCNFREGYHVENENAKENTYYTFFNHHIHNSVFCNVNWYDTHWAQGRWYNVTFNYNTFTHHNHYEDRFENFHYRVIPCRDFNMATDTMVHWTIYEGSCHMLIHRPNSMWQSEEMCMNPDNHMMMKHVCGHEHSSVRFWDCKFQECMWDHCHMDSIEWRHVMHHKSMLQRSNMIANHFVMTHHKDSQWMHMTLSRWNRFTANSFHDHRHHWTQAMNVTHHSCKFYHHTWDCRDCMHMSFFHCFIENMNMERTCNIGVWHMHDCSTLGMVMQGRMNMYRYCHVYHNDISWMNYHMASHESTCPMKYSYPINYHNMHWCKYNPHHHTCAHMWMNPEQHCCYGHMSCHMMPHHFWMRDNMECRDNDYAFNWRMGEWRDSYTRDMHYRKWTATEHDPHSWSTHHRLPMVHCMNAMRTLSYEMDMAIRHIQRDMPTELTYAMMDTYDMMETPDKFFQLWNAKRSQFNDHWHCLHMFEY